MKSALILIGTGLAIVLVSLVTWSMTGGAEEAGDAAAIEQALTQAAGARTAPTTLPEPLATPGPAEEQPAPSQDGTPDTPNSSIPRFTIGQRPEGPDRVPIGLRIPALDQDAPIIPTGVAGNGDMEVPNNVSDVAWYKYGAAPGEAGSAVLAAHVDLAGQGPGVFLELRDLEPGSEIVVDFDDGTTETYITEARTTYDKTELPTEAIFSREGTPTLTLITCGGGFNEQIRSYDSNVVVYAVPVDPELLPSA